MVKQASNGLIDFNSILMSVNLLVAALLAYGFSQLGYDNPYINPNPLLLPQIPVNHPMHAIDQRGKQDGQGYLIKILQQSYLDHL